MTRGRMVWIEHEPCSLGAGTVVALLERIGWHEAADLIKRLAERDAAEYRESQRWKTEFYKLKEKYEPTAAEPARVSHRPDWTCDG